jgi:HK97 family phage prohead protease
VDRRIRPFQVREIKARENGGWEVAGYASTFGGQPDSYGDVVVKGAFLDSIAKRKTKLLAHHDMSTPIGRQLDLHEDDNGLFGRWTIVPTTAGKDVHTLIEEELIEALSIGFVPVDVEYRDDGVRLLKKVDLYEVSCVAVPANDQAVITSFKSSISTDMPIHQLLLNAADYLDVATREAEAFMERRAADKGRDLNEKQREAALRLQTRAGAWVETLAALVTVPDAEAKAGNLVALEAVNLEIAMSQLRRMRAKYPALKGA